MLATSSLINKMEPSCLAIAGGLAATALTGWGPYTALAGNLCVQGGIAYGIHCKRGEESTPLFPLCVGASLTFAATSCWQGYATGRPLHWLNAGLSTLGPIAALVVSREQLKELWTGESEDSPGPLGRLWQYWGDGFGEKSQAAAFFLIGGTIPLAIQNWLSPNPTLTATLTSVGAGLGGVAWTRLQEDGDKRWNNGICNPLFLGAMVAVAGLDLWQLGDYLAHRTTQPFWGVGRVLQLITLAFSGLTVGAELVQAAKEPSLFQ